MGRRFFFLHLQHTSYFIPRSAAGAAAAKTIKRGGAGERWERSGWKEKDKGERRRRGGICLQFKLVDPPTVDDGGGGGGGGGGMTGGEARDKLFL
eukprot:763342-Hanusia_phi.AAC.3